MTQWFSTGCGMKVQCLPSLLADNCRAWRRKRHRALGTEASGMPHRSCHLAIPCRDGGCDFQSLLSLGLVGLGWAGMPSDARSGEGRVQGGSRAVFGMAVPGVPLKVSTGIASCAPSCRDATEWKGDGLCLHTTDTCAASSVSERKQKRT